MNKANPVFILTGALAFALPAFADEPTKEQLDFFEGKIAVDFQLQRKKSWIGFFDFKQRFKKSVKIKTSAFW